LCLYGVTLFPVISDEGKPYLKAASKFHVWILFKNIGSSEVEEPTSSEPFHGLNSYYWRPKGDRNERWKMALKISILWGESKKIYEVGIIF
jgi:hypothetical protein